MSLHSKIETKLSEALKAQDKKTYSTLRLIIAAIKDLMIAKKIKDKSTLPDNDLVALLKKMVKQRNDSAKIYLEQKRDELANVEISQADIISEFLPAQLSESDLSEIIDKVITDIGADSMKDMGKVISVVTEKVSGQAEGRVIAEIVKRKLMS